MNGKPLSIEQFVAALTQHNLGASAADIASKLQIAEQTFYY